tara:strand:- start:1171 stop:1812 length:642 start_codon:yes stop_codon:yes gene_type:complete
MADKDLGEGIENFEAEIENLKNTKMKIFGITMTPTTIGMLFALISTILGGLYGSFKVYDDYMAMKEIVQNIDVEAIQVENDKVIVKLNDAMLRIDEAIEYTRDIKSGLRDDILGIEKQVDRMDDKVREQEEDNRAVIQNAEERFENKRDALQNDYDTKANALRDSNNSRMTDLESKVERDNEALRVSLQRKMDELDATLNSTLQRALDNPLAN